MIPGCTRTPYRTFLLASLLAACGPQPRPGAVEGPVDAPVDQAAAPASDGAEGAEDAEPEAPKLTPQQVEARDKLSEGRRAATAGNLAGAASAFEAAAALEPGLGDPAYNLGVLAERQGDDEGARRAYGRALAADPEFEPAVTALANMHLRVGKRDEALAVAQAALATRPKSLSLRNAVNRVLLTFPGREESVIQDTKVILREDEKNVAAMVNLATAYHQQGKFELAVAILLNAKALEPSNPEIPTRTALDYQALGENIKARLALEAAVALPGGGTAESHNNLGLIYHAAGDYEGAGEQFEKALARSPGMLAAQVNLGNALRGQQRYTDSVKALLKALKMQPDSPDAYFNLGILYLDGEIPEIEPSKRFEKAVTYFERYKQLRGAARADDPVDQYIAEAKKRIEVEQKRANQARNKPKAAPEAAPAPADPPDEEEQ